jgi:hypothetical protein
MEPRHIIGVMIAEEHMDIFFREGATFRCFSGIPKDAKLLGVHADFQRRCFIAHYEHPSFPLCPIGAEPERRHVGYEIIEHPHAQEYDVIPIKIGMSENEYLDMRRWICERAADIEGREYHP